MKNPNPSTATWTIVPAKAKMGSHVKTICLNTREDITAWIFRRDTSGTTTKIDERAHRCSGICYTPFTNVNDVQLRQWNALRTDDADLEFCGGLFGEIFSLGDQVLDFLLAVCRIRHICHCDHLLCAIRIPRFSLRWWHYHRGRTRSWVITYFQWNIRLYGLYTYSPLAYLSMVAQAA